VVEKHKMMWRCWMDKLGVVSIFRSGPARMLF
jgi:hypothetical protein